MWIAVGVAANVACIYMAGYSDILFPLGSRVGVVGALSVLGMIGILAALMGAHAAGERDHARMIDRLRKMRQGGSDDD